MTAAARIGLDIGGTFTDVVLETHDRRFTAKVLTTPAEPEQGAMEAMEAILKLSGLQAGQVTEVIHGTTLATNAIIERKGARTALLTTEGFRDSIEIGTEGRPDQYDTQLVKPQPLVARRSRFPVRERLDAQGRVLIPLDPAAVRALVPTLVQQGIESVAIGFLHSYVDLRHEALAAQVLREALPGLTVTLSGEVSPEFREYERFSTACANAYIQPLMARYLGRFETMRRERGFNCPMLLMLSGGGLTTVETAQRFPVRLVESGPAGGAIFAGVVAKRCGLDEVVSFDMGGTTAKLCMIDQGAAQTSRSFEVARVYRFKKGSGLPLRVPVVELVEIGAGGGSIARLDPMNRITVGPDSAAADPGPACYGRGGSLPTVTDANLAMGRLDPLNFAGGDLELFPAAAAQALAEHLGQPLGLGAQAVAFGVSEIVDENMSGAARVHAIESGKSLPSRTLIAFGGGGPLHAARVAEKLDIARVIIPASAGVGSAVGFLRAPIAFEVVRTQYQRLGAFDFGLINRTLADMEQTAAAIVSQATQAPRHAVRRAYMRYVGQGHEILIDLGQAVFDADSAALLRQGFEREYGRVYGRSLGGLADVEVASWVVTVTTRPMPDPVAGRSLSAAEAVPTETREVFDPGSRQGVMHAVFERDGLLPGTRIAGPAVIVERETSTVVSPRFDAEINVYGDIELTRKEARA